MRSTASADATTAGVILAGGRASRMGGRDKAFAAVGGEPIAVRTVGLFQRLFPQVIVATNRPERFARSRRRDRGRPPSRLRSAGGHPRRHAREPGAVGVRRRLRHARARPRGHPLDARPAAHGGRRRAAVGGRRRAAARALRACTRCRSSSAASPADAGRCASSSPAIRVDYVDERELRALGGAAQSLLNVNTPEELAALGGRFDEAER